MYVCVMHAYIHVRACACASVYVCVCARAPALLRFKTASDSCMYEFISRSRVNVLNLDKTRLPHQTGQETGQFWCKPMVQRPAGMDMGACYPPLK